MTVKKARKTQTKSPTTAPKVDVAAAPATSPTPRALKAFYDGGGEFENFAFARFYWEAGEGERESIVPRIDKKLHPVRSETGRVLASAAKVDLLLPAEAPQDYMSADHLVRRYEETLPAHEINAYAQVTIRFPGAVNLHRPFEMVRSWAQGYFAEVPVLLVLHAPHEWGSSNAGHLHCIVFPRRLGLLGWGAMERAIASDGGQREAHEAWTAFKEQWRREPGTLES